MKNTNDMKNASIHDDPMLTAFALGELAGDDAAVFEKQLAVDATLRAEVEAIRATAAMLREGFVAEPAETLTASQRSHVMNPSESSPARQLARSEADTKLVVTRTHFLSRTRWIGGGLAAAAMIGLTITAAIIYNGDRADTQSGFAIGGERGRNAESAINAPTVAGDAGSINLRPGARSSSVEPAARELADSKEKSEQKQAGATALGQNQSGGNGLRDGLTAGAGGVPAPMTSAPPMPAQAPAPIVIRPDNRREAPPAGKPRDGETPAPSPPPPPSPSGGAHGGGGTGGEGAAAAPGQPGGTRDRTDAPAAKPAATPTSPAPAADPAPGRQSPPADLGAAPSEAGDALSRDADDRAAGARGGLRDPSRPQSETRPAAPQFDAQQIAAMEEGEALRALEETRRAKDAESLDSRTRSQLVAQDERLVARLRAIERADAEEYSRINDNPFIKPVGTDALSTFALDVDTASYSNIRRFLSEGRLPPADAVRVEEMINYFRYDYPPPTAGEGEEPAPFSADLELAPAPWNPQHRLVRVGIRGKDVRMDMRPATSLVFLIDVSGSMNQPNKLPLVKDALNMLIQQLNGDDRLAIVTYAGNAGLVLDSCFVNAENRVKIDAAIENMQPGGSTNGSGGINLAYDVAKQHFIKDGVNRVILCTDGDFNVGVSGDEALVQLIEEQRKSNVFLSVLGFGTGNLKDSKMEKLADAGNGNFAYIDSIKEAKKVLVEQAGGTLVTIAKDVKFQVEFNPARVGAYRLIGYENRLLAAEDFNNDLKDAGEIGSGHTMTALYEIVPVGAEVAALAKNEPQGEVDELEYQKPAAAASQNVASDNLLTVKIRYKEPEGDVSSLLRFPLKDAPVSDVKPSDDFRFAAAVAEFGMLLRRSQYVAGGTFDHVIAEAEGSRGADEEGYRAEFIELVKKAKALDAK